jgi:isocitrate/isopropylmalate dehydrogenase
MRVYKIASIPGDGIGPEVISAACKVLETLAAQDGGFRLEVENFPWSSDYYLKYGHYIPDGGLHTPDLGGKATTAEVTQAVCERIGRHGTA